MEQSYDKAAAEKIAMRPLQQCLRHWALTKPVAVAVVDNGTAYSYRQVAINTVQYIKMLEAAGLRKGMLVGIVSDYRYLHLLLLVACSAIGATTISLTAFELDADLELQRRCELFLLGSEVPETIAENLKGVIRLSQDLLDHALNTPVDDFSALNTVPGDNDIVQIARSSGTTGTSKFIPLTEPRHRARFRSYVWSFTDFSQISDLIIVFNLTMGAAAAMAFISLHYGKTMRFCTIQDLEQNVAAADRSFVQLLPFYIAETVKSCGGRPWKKKAYEVRSIGGPVPDHLRSQILDLFASNVISDYGSMETSAISVTGGPEAGKLYPGVSVRICSEAGDLLPPGRIGEIEVKSDQTIGGYLWDPELNRKHFRDGWFRLFDLGYGTEAGELIIVGRGDDVLNIGGFKVAPAHTENQIKLLDGVNDAVLLGLPDAQGIEELHAYIERNNPADDSALQERILRTIYFGVREVTLHFVSKLPRTESGKVRRGELRDGLAAARAKLAMTEAKLASN